MNHTISSNHVAMDWDLHGKRRGMDEYIVIDIMDNNTAMWAMAKL